MIDLKIEMFKNNFPQTFCEIESYLKERFEYKILDDTLRKKIKDEIYKIANHFVNCGIICPGDATDFAEFLNHLIIVG
jgi:hypothetical protein